MLHSFSTAFGAGEFWGQLIVAIKFGRLLLLWFFFFCSMLGWLWLCVLAPSLGRGIQSLPLPVMQKKLGSPETPKQYHFSDWAAETDIYDIRPKKKKSSYSSAVRFLYCLTDFKPVPPCVAVSRHFFCLQPSLFMNPQTVLFPRTVPLLANCFESCLGKFPFASFRQNFFRCLV